MALIHERLSYSGTAADLDFAEYVRALAGELMDAYGAGSRGIELHSEIDIFPTSLRNWEAAWSASPRKERRSR